VAVVIFITASLGFLSAPVVIAQDKTTTATEAPQRDTSFIDTNGTAHVTRVIPVPGTISIEAQKMLARVVSDALEPDDIAAQRKALAEWQARAGEEFRTIYPANVAMGAIAGVPVKIVTPVAIPEASSAYTSPVEPSPLVIGTMGLPSIEGSADSFVFFSANISEGAKRLLPSVPSADKNERRFHFDFKIIRKPPLMISVKKFYIFTTDLGGS
jgi:hypothetical protein